MDRIHPACSENLFGPLLTAAWSADEFDPIHHHCRSQFLPEEKPQLRETGENRTQEIRVIEVGDVILRIAARAAYVAGDGRHDEDRVVAHLVNDLPQEVQRVLEGENSLREKVKLTGKRPS
jgi:hypothetical protein